MDSSPPRYQPLQQPLTSENVGSLPSTRPAIDAFIREQRLNSRFYVREAALERQDAQQAATGHSRAIQRSISATSTPLVSRIEMRQEVVKPSPVATALKELTKTITETRQEKVITKKELFYGNTFPDTSRRRKRTKPSVVVPSEDDDHINRLKERRERKRARKSIIKEKTPDSASDPSIQSMDESEEAQISQRRRRGKRSKLPSGIAMMEAFTAPNVKSSRLTLKPRNNSTLFKQAKSGVTVNLAVKQTQRSPAPAQKRRRVMRSEGDRPNLSKRKAAQAPQKQLISKILSESSESTSDSHSDLATESNSALDNGVISNTKPTNKEIIASPSESWDIGSVLPAEGQSVLEETRRRPGVSSSRQRALSPAQSSEPAILTIPTPWKFDEKTVNGNILAIEHPQQEDGGTLELPPAHGDLTIPTNQSKYFISPLVPIPHHIMQPPNGDDTSPMDNSEDAGIVESEEVISGPCPQQYSYERETSGDNEVGIPNVSSSDSLDKLLREYDVDEIVYGRTLALTESQRPQKSEMDYAAISSYPFGNEGPYSDYLQEWNSGEDYRENLSRDDPNHQDGLSPQDEPTNIDDYSTSMSYQLGRVWNDQLMGNTIDDIQYESSIECYVQDIDAEWPSDGEQAPYGEEDADMLTQHNDFDPMEERHESCIEKLTPLNSDSLEHFVDEEGDVLPLATGKLLLLGMSSSHSTSTINRPAPSTREGESFVPTYGQSVQDIEVGIGKHLAQRW